MHLPLLDAALDHRHRLPYCTHWIRCVCVCVCGCVDRPLLQAAWLKWFYKPTNTRLLGICICVCVCVVTDRRKWRLRGEIPITHFLQGSFASPPPPLPSSTLLLVSSQHSASPPSLLSQHWADKARRAACVVGGRTQSLFPYPPIAESGQWEKIARREEVEGVK